MSYTKRISLLMVLDSIIVLTAIYAGYFILNPTLKVFTIPTLIFSSICLLISHHLFAFIYRLYQKAWEYASVGEMVAIIRAITLSIVTTACMQILINHDVYVRVMAVTWMLHILCPIHRSLLQWNHRRLKAGLLLIEEPIRLRWLREQVTR